jgi:hypothetical protein
VERQVDVVRGEVGKGYEHQGEVQAHRGGLLAGKKIKRGYGMRESRFGKGTQVFLKKSARVS